MKAAALLRRSRVQWVAGLVVALLLAGGISHYASSSPDGLQHVATETGFSDTATEHVVADGPLADYRFAGVTDDRLSGGLAGVVGTGVVLVLASGLTWALHRPRPRTAGAPRDAGTSQDPGTA